MSPEPPPISDPHSTPPIQAKDISPESTRSPLRTLFWGVMGVFCLGLDALLLIDLVVFRSAPGDKAYTLSPSFDLLLLTLVVLLLTWFSLRQCFRRD